MKKIQYSTKSTSANTKYVQICKDDYIYLMDSLDSIIDFYNICKETRQLNIVHRLVTPNKSFLVQGADNKYRPNSVLTAAQGILDNIRKGTQRDFSIKTLSLITDIFDEMERIVGDSFEIVTFVPVAGKPKVSYNYTIGDVTTTFGSLFETGV